MSCRIARAREWASRIIHEMSYHDDSVFVTLTYNPENLPSDNSISKDDLQRFFKRLRRDLDYDGRKIKYFSCGEYGDLNDRPHYHAIVFGLSLRDTDKRLIQQNWPVGFCHFGTVTFESARYVTSYVMKKYNGEKAKEAFQDRQVPFCLMSKGIGKNFVMDNYRYLYENLGFTVKGEKVGLPRYYKNLLRIEPQEYIEDILETTVSERQKLAEKGVGVEGWSAAKNQKREHQSATLDAKIKLFKKGSM